jgi:hypothetical protein
MERIKAVVHYTNGKIIKGFTHDFSPSRDRFHLFQEDNPSGQAIEVFIKELKALFTVRDFTGDFQHNKRKHYKEEEKPSGRKVEVTFTDGEVLLGSTLGYDLKRQGFFIFPADPNSNNVRVFVVSSAVEKVRQV